MLSGLSEDEWVFTDIGHMFVSLLTTDRKLLSYNFETKCTEYVNILSITKSPTPFRMKKIMMDYSTQKSTISYSDDMVLFKQIEDGTFQHVKHADLSQGDQILSLKNEQEIWAPKLWVHSGTYKHFAYNIEIEGNKPYFAGKVIPMLIQKTTT